MTTAVIASGILGAAAVLHLYWAAGGRRGFDAVVPQLAGRRLISPGAAMTLLVALGLFLMAGMILWRAGEIRLSLPFDIARYSVPLMAALFLARAIGDFRYVGWSKRVRGTRFARLDDMFYAPLCLTLAICCAIVALG